MREAIQRGDGSRSQAKIIKQSQMDDFSQADTSHHLSNETEPHLLLNQ